MINAYLILSSWSLVWPGSGVWLVCHFHRSLSVVLAAVAPAPVVVPHSAACERGGRGEEDRGREKK